MNTSILNLTDVIYPIRPPTTPTKEGSTYSLFGQDVVCSQCKSTDSLSNVVCKQHYLCSSCLLHSSYQVCSFCPPQFLHSQQWNATQHFPCVKLTNIPWDASQNDIRVFFGNLHIPSISIYAQSIHILMDRTTGKTMSDAYVELATMEDLQCAIETKNQRTLKGRIVSVKACSQDELLNAVFPKWRGTFSGMAAIPPDTKVVQSMSTAVGGGGSTCPPFITREEINSLLVVCKNYKLHFSRKCAERPFENIISIITKYPWHQAHLITTMHRDHVYEMLKLAIESLMNHLSKDYVQIEPSLLNRLVRAGLLCPAFTEPQKVVLLQVTRMNCPMDLTYLFMKHEFVSPTSDPVFYHSPLSSRHSFYDDPPTYNNKRSYTRSPAPLSNRNNNQSLISPITPTQSSIGTPYHKPSLSPWARSYSPLEEKDGHPTTWSTPQNAVVVKPSSNSIMTI
ncbi:hypothetical protein BC941DRAFT_433253 [Chlamydoabsidia padenii]|nr:hypothetical protein BC941DRAFT_433253 [Chlamydoabsidia padenii]